MGRDRNTLSSFKRISLITLAFCTLLLVSGRSLFAQVDEGSISGAVQDPSGAVIPSAQVTLLNTDQGLTLTTTTNSGGEYTFSPVRIGHYSVSATAPGFTTTNQQNLQVSVGQALQVNIQLKPGATSETVQVTTAPPQLQTSESSVGQVVTGQTINNLPLNGRNFTFLAQLGAGVNSSQPDTRGNAASGAFSANGLKASQNNYLLDGIDNNSNAVDFLNGTNFIVLPPLDAVAEFKVQTGDFSAELGRAAGAVLNATIKSGTNSIHGAAWEFFRNDVLDAADWFEDNNRIKKGELRQNQFGAAVGGPVIKNKIFFFGDYEGLRRVQGNTQSGITVPTAAERNSKYTNLADIISGAARPDALGRQIPLGTILDPATTRSVAAGARDPVSGIANTSANTVYVRDPFGTCPASTTNFTLAACGLNQLPANRLDPNAISLLNLYPLPTSGGATSNYGSSPALFEHRNAFDVRVDFDITQSDQIFSRFSWVDDPNFIPGPFTGVADGGGFNTGDQAAKSYQSASAWTHVFSPSMINVARVGVNHLLTSRYGPAGNQTGIPAQYGIQGIPQSTENGGLPQITFSGLSTLGSNAYLPSNEVSDTLQITDDFTKTYGQHAFKMGIEFQNVKFSTLQPAYSRGNFDYGNNSSSITFTDIPNVGGGATGRAQFLLTPEATNVANGVSYVGGADQVQASNINKTYDEKKYFASYFQDDWKITPTLTLNLGVRYDWFGPILETNGGQANFIPGAGGPFSGPTFLLPATGKDNRQLSSTANNPALNGNGFLDLLAKDNITLLETNKYGQGLVQTQKTNFSPRIGFAYQANDKLVARAGFGLFYNSFDNQGYGPNIGENYPFVFNFNFQQQNLGIPSVTPISAGTPWSGCPTAGPGGTATLSSGFSCIAFTPLAVNAQSVALQGLQFNYKTPVTISSNLSFQYALTRTLSAQVAYVYTRGNHVQVGVGANNVTSLLPAGASTQKAVAFPDFGHGASYNASIGTSNYNALQTKLEKQYDNGLQFLAAYTWSKTLGDALDLLNNSLQGYRAPQVPGYGPEFDYGLAAYDIRNVFHLSGGYELPFGKGKKYFATASTIENALVGGWSGNVISSLQGGQPVTYTCPTATTSGTNCFDVKVAGQSPKLGFHTDGNGKLNWIGNPAAFQQPCPTGAAPTTGCIPSTQYLGGSQGTSVGPGLARFDFSAFKAIPINERFSMQFRAEFFNILNHPTFNAPNFGGNGVVAISNSGNFTSSNFGEIGSTRLAPYDPRQIQFGLKLYY
jgi:Carboxypeptidase regulatory-like domain/TonB-dependent Receptor Plug Domain